MNGFTHIDEKGNPLMVDVSQKQIAHRTAAAISIVVLPKEVLDKFSGNDIQNKKPFIAITFLKNYLKDTFDFNLAFLLNFEGIS